jgi:hypothetical protein
MRRLAAMTSLFISHASSDREFVEDELVGLLRALGFDPWYAEEDVPSADEWERTIHKGLETSKWFVLVMSRAAAGSPWVRAEVGWAVKRRLHYLLPIIIEDVAPEELNLMLASIQHADYRGNKRKTGRERLISLLVSAEYRPQSFSAVLEGMTRCPSKEMLTLVRVVSRPDSLEATIIAANERANQIFGRMAGKSIIGTSLADIFGQVLPQWMDGDDIRRFTADQERMLAAVKRGEEIYARIPFRINQNHPHRDFRGRAYLPVTIAYSQPRTDHGVAVEDFLVLYAALHDICAELGAAPDCGSM